MKATMDTIVKHYKYRRNIIPEGFLQGGMDLGLKTPAEFHIESLIAR